MKVLHIIPSISPVRGGPSQAVLEIVSALCNLDIEAEIVTTNDNGNSLLDVPLCSKTQYQQIPVWFFPRFSPSIHSFREFAFSSQLTSWLWRNITNYDLLHIHAIFSYPSTIAMYIARLKNIPYICRPLGQLCQWSLQQSYQKKQAYLSLIEKANLNGSQVLHFTSEQEKQEAANLNLECPSFILPHGIAIPTQIPEARSKLRHQLQVRENEPIILFLSRLHHKKGLNYLIPALGKVTHQSFTFVLAGNGDAEYEIEIEKMLHQYNIYNRTHRVGFVEGEYKNLLLQGADIFALTSFSENFGIAVLEALGAGIPALVTPGVALSSVLKQERIGYITDLDINAITSSIEYCLNNLPELKHKGDRARQVILEQYTWDKIATKMSKIYQTILNNQNLTNY
ncbi:glycosyl transferase group 1 [Stanieria cyanosphaera PCC 7437]|uniref:Glycosyl transferase group 1 n=1 Tax=Stanieria cyanosphaera (strain ATCC 29371 / PCC 7437) TaxID=111780 RepID=K9XT53_STAC7|nr:glycosyltransferase [Stanieria cyanosphaera]AFZ35785.1 glycosyl transferase group 1 [Stanieria cyanosphaera PCC 7437]